MKLIVVENPFKRTDTKVSTVEYQGETLLELRNKTFPEEVGVSISINGGIVPQQCWATRRPRNHEEIMMVPVVSGGDGGGKMILNIVIMLAVIWFTAGAGAQFALGLGEMALGAGAAGAAMFGTAVIMAATGLLLAVLTPTPKAKKPGLMASQENSQTFGWSPSSVQDQGIPVPMFYGKNKVFGNVIATNIELTKDQTGQILNALFALGSGPTRNVEGSVYGDSDYGITDLKINDQPIDNFTSVSHEERFGTLTQTVIDNFNDTKTQRSVSVIVKYDDDQTYTTSNPGFAQLEVVLSFPSGLYFADDQGGLSDYTVGIKIEVSVKDADSWTTIGEEDITDKRATAILREYNTKTAFPDNLDITKDYDIRVSKTTPDNSDTRYGQKLSFSAIKEVILDDFIYPTTPLVSIKALATDQLSGSIGFSCIQEGKVIRVYNGATWSIAHSTNPAWIIWDILTQPIIAGAGTAASPYTISQKGGNDVYRGINPDLSADQPRLNLEAFYELAQFCEDQVPDGEGTTITNITQANPGVVSSEAHGKDNGDSVIITAVEGMTEVNNTVFTVANKTADTFELQGVNTSGYGAWSAGGIASTPENRINFNGGFDSETSVWEAALKVCEIARCVLIWNGLEITLAIDKPTSPTQMFTVGNIYQKTFDESFLPQADRASELEIQFNDSEQDYKRVPFNIFNTAIDNPSNKISLDLFGITKGSEAWRAGIFRLNTTNLLKRTVTFDVDIDAVACALGDVVYVQHDIPNWGSTSAGLIGEGDDPYGGGGRLLHATNTGNAVLTVDRKMYFDDPDWDAGANIYELMVRTKNDTIETKIITGVAGENNEIITVAGTFGMDPEVTDIWAAGAQNLVAKEFRVINIEKSQEQRIKLRLIEYNAGVYASDFEEADLPGSDDVYNPSAYSDLEVSNLLLTENAAIDESGILSRDIILTYDIPSDVPWRSAEVYFKPTTITDWEPAGQTSNNTLTIYGVAPLTTYSVKVISVDNFGVRTIFVDSPTENITTGSTADFEGQHLQRKVTGLQLLNQGNDTNFTGKDAKFVWNKIDAVDQDYAANEEPNGAGTNLPTHWFRDYEVKIFDTNDNWVRTDYIKENFFTYTYEKNYDDGLTNPLRTFRIEVRARDIYHRISAKVAKLTVANEAPAIPTNVIFNLLPKSYQVTFNAIVIPDITGYVIYASQTSGFSPSASNLVYDGPDPFSNISVFNLPYGLWYVKIAAYDTFGTDSLNYSNEYTVGDDEAPAVPEGIQAMGGIKTIMVTWDPNIELDLSGYQVWYSTVSPVVTSGDPDYDTNGGILRTSISFDVNPSTTYYVTMRAYDISNNFSDFTAEVLTTTGLVTTTDIQVGAVTADKINTVRLSAIVAELGDVLAGTVTGTVITGGTLQTDTSGRRITIDKDGIKLKYGTSSGRYGTIGNGGSGVVYGADPVGSDEVYGSGFLAQLYDIARGITLAIKSEQTSIADIQLFMRTNLPSSGQIGDVVIYSPGGTPYLAVCTSAGTPATWYRAQLIAIPP